MEVVVDRRNVPKVDLREFWGLDAQNEDSTAKIHMSRRDVDVRTVVAYQLGGRLDL